MLYNISYPCNFKICQMLQDADKMMTLIQVAYSKKLIYP